MPRLAIIHFLPLELYPPVTNLLNILDDDNFAGTIDVYSTGNSISSGTRPFASGSSNCTIHRPSGNRPAGWLKYAIFNWVTFWSLVRRRPDTVLYYDSISAIPAILYWFIFRRTRLMVHYHEYVTPGEYQSGMKLVRLAHRLESRWYTKYSWISQTNADRMERFLADEKLTAGNKVARIFPNYPPASWLRSSKQASRLPMKLVYVGALNLDTTYIAEMGEWVNQYNGRVELDIYSNNANAATRQYLQEAQGEWLRFHGAVDYDQLPETLSKYDTGLILYKGHIPNYIYNAPNKLFEYLAVGLDVWYPRQMVSCANLVDDAHRPLVVPVDMTQLKNWTEDQWPPSSDKPFRDNQFVAAKAAAGIVEFLTAT